MDSSTYWFFEKFIDDNFCLLYDGNFNDEITEKIIGLSEYNFEYQDDFNRTKKRVSFLLAECFQNIIRHGGKIEEDKSGNVDAGFFLTRNIVDRYFISSGNLIKNDNVPGLKKQLDKINNLDNESLHELYVDVLANKGFSERGGAGLGLIEIARKSGQKIEFVFDDFKDGHSIFYSHITLQARLDIEKGRCIPDFYISEAMKFHEKMLENGIVMIQKGDFSNSSILPLLDILEKNFSGLLKKSPSKKDVYNVMVEMLQNISKFALDKKGKKDGIFLIRRKGEHFVISAGNFIDQQHIVSLESQIKLLNSLNKEEQKKRYLQALKEENSVEEVGARIELINIARRSKEPIQYQFKQTTHKQFFFTISVIV
ncbi:MAG: SiaB family protein kinase [Bacteroidota bacterium]